MNPNYTEFKFPQIKAHPWHKVCLCSEISIFCFPYSYCVFCFTTVDILINLCLSDISQTNAPWSTGSCLKVASVFTKPTMHCCKFFLFFFLIESIKLNVGDCTHKHHSLNLLEVENFPSLWCCCACLCFIYFIWEVY